MQNLFDKHSFSYTKKKNCVCYKTSKPEAGFIDSEHSASTKNKTSALVYNEKVMNCY